MTQRRVNRVVLALRLRLGLAMIVMASMIVMAPGGCQRALFPENAPRTQFDAYDLQRRRYVPLEEPDLFGRPQPALRARLARR